MVACVLMELQNKMAHVGKVSLMLVCRVVCNAAGHTDTHKPLGFTVLTQAHDTLV